MCKRWVGDGTDCNILTPSFSGYSSTSFSFCWAAQPGFTEGRKPSVSSWFSLPRTATRTPTNWLQLTQTACGTGLYNCVTTTCFLWASHLHRIQPVHRSRWYLRPDAPVSWLTARSKVNMLQYITVTKTFYNYWIFSHYLHLLVFMSFSDEHCWTNNKHRATNKPEIVWLWKISSQTFEMVQKVFVENIRSRTHFFLVVEEGCDVVKEKFRVEINVEWARQMMCGARWLTVWVIASQPDMGKVQCWPSKPLAVAQRIEGLSLYGSRWALSKDSCFKSYPSRREVYLVKNVVR